MRFVGRFLWVRQNDGKFRVNADADRVAWSSPNIGRIARHVESANYQGDSTAIDAVLEDALGGE